MSSINPNDSSLTNYQFQGRLGITDLWAEDPWLSNYGNWPIFSARFGVTEEEYKAYPQRYANRVRTRNEQYISELNSQGRYGEEYTIVIGLKSNPLLDTSAKLYPAVRPMESYRMVFLDLSGFDGKPNIHYVEQKKL